MGVDYVNLARYIHQHTTVQGVEVFQVIERNTRITRLFALFDVLECHVRCLGQKDVHVRKPDVLLVLVRVHLILLWPHELLLEQVFPKHVTCTEETTLVNDDVILLGFQRLKRL